MNIINLFLSILLALSSSLILAYEKIPASNSNLEAINAMQAAKKAGDMEGWYHLINETFREDWDVAVTSEQVIVAAQRAMTAEDLEAYYILVSAYFDITLETATTPRQVRDAAVTALNTGNMDVYYFLMGRYRDMKERQGKQKLNTVTPRIAANSAFGKSVSVNAAAVPEKNSDESVLVSYARAMVGYSPRKSGESALMNYARDRREREKRASDSPVVKYGRYRMEQASENNNESALIKYARERAYE